MGPIEVGNREPYTITQAHPNLSPVGHCSDHLVNGDAAGAGAGEMLGASPPAQDGPRGPQDPADAARPVAAGPSTSAGSCGLSCSHAASSSLRVRSPAHHPFGRAHVG